MGKKIYGYIRVSTVDQSTDRQRMAMHEQGVADACLFIDRVSGKDFNRPAYRRLVKRLKPNDTLVVKSIDRFGRNYEEIIEQWRLITRKKRANIVVIDTPILNTSPERDLMGTVIADIILQLQSAFAQAEREAIRQRQSEGIVAAKARGVKFGRPTIKVPRKFYALHAQWAQGNLSAREAAKQLGVSHFTFYRWAKALLAP